MWSGRVLLTTLRSAQIIPKVGKELLANQKKVPYVAVVSFHNTVSRLAKLFVDKENKFAHDVLEQSLKPYQILRLATEADIPTSAVTELPTFVLNPTKDITNDELFGHFCTFSRYSVHTGSSITEPRFREFTQLYCDLSHRLSDEQLVETLRLIALLPPVDSVKSPNFVELWNTLDVECCRRIERWSSDQLLLVCDAWYALNLARICEFVWEALRKLGRKVLKMRPEPLVHTMFFCNVMRRPVFDMFDFEVNMARCADAMTLQELGVMAMGFFKTQTPIRNAELLALLYKRLEAELDTVEDITLVAILKVLRYSSKLPQVPLMLQLLDALCAQVERISVPSCLHVALLGSDVQCCHERIIELILQRFNRDLAQTRLKDIERICLVIGVFNYRSASQVERQLCAKILALLPEKMDEIMKYPRCLGTCLHFLTQMGFYDMEMISSVLDMRFVRHAYGKSKVMGREIFQLDSFVKINLKYTDYAGHQLQDKQRRTMGKMLTHYIPERNSKFKINATDRMLLEIKESTNSFFRPNIFKHILPHFERPDILICYDHKKRQALPLHADCPEDYSGVILTRKELLGDQADAAHIDTVVIVVAGWNNVVRDTDRHTGLFELKLQQLRLLGHKYIVIYWHEWRELETQTDRLKFIKRRLATVINL